MIKSFISKFLPHYPTVGTQAHLTRLKLLLYDVTKIFCHRVDGGRRGRIGSQEEGSQYLKISQNIHHQRATPLVLFIRAFIYQRS